MSNPFLAAGAKGVGVCLHTFQPPGTIDPTSRGKDSRMHANRCGAVAAVFPLPITPSRDENHDPIPTLIAKLWAAFFASCALTAHTDNVSKAVIDRADAKERAALKAVLTTPATSMNGLRAKLRFAVEIIDHGGDEWSLKVITSALEDLDSWRESPP